MRKGLLAAGLSAAVLGGALATSAWAGETLDRVMKDGVLNDVTDQNYPPFSFLNANNEIDGFDIDVAKEIAKRLGVKLKVDTPAWEVITAGNWHGRWDLCVCSMTPTTERAEVLDFVVQYWEAPAVLVVNKDDTRIASGKDLNGLKVGVEAGSSYERYVNKSLDLGQWGGAPTYPFEQATAAPYDSESTAFQDLALGAGKRIDAIVASYLTAAPHAKEDPRFRIIEGDLFHEPIYIASDKGDPEWEAKVTGIVEEMKKDGTLKTISTKWIGRDITE